MSMNRNSNIFSVPEGYFEQLRSRLETIPAQQSEPAEVITLWSRLRPYAALAACFVIAFSVGSFILGRTAVPVQDELSFQDICYADLVPVTNPYIIYDDSPYLYEEEQISATEDDIVEYLISSGASVDYIAYLLNQ